MPGGSPPSVILFVLFRQVRPDILFRIRIQRFFVIFRPEVPERVFLRVPPRPVAHPGTGPAGITTTTLPFSLCHPCSLPHCTRAIVHSCFGK